MSIKTAVHSILYPIDTSFFLADTIFVDCMYHGSIHTAKISIFEKENQNMLIFQFLVIIPRQNMQQLSNFCQLLSGIYLHLF